MTVRLSIAITSTVLATAGTAALRTFEPATTTNPPVDFGQDVQPILSQHCIACHGPVEADRKANLNLLDRATVVGEREAGASVIVPGNRSDSELWLRITDPDDPMPPTSAHKPLTAEQVDILGRWIDQGADYTPHWAFQPPTRSARPADQRTIDAFIRERLAREGLAPSEPADRITLLRRACFDLTGLPPSPAEADAFLADQSPDAFARVVDRLLDSPHFGERMAMFWLDLVRYADTVGYHGDQDHNAWPYRDWVIEAFNSNMPFDQFTIEQLAGDLLENPTQSQLIATCYNRLLQTSHEGGVQLKEYRAIYMADRVRNVSETWMGATIGCAQCHDHKYDPYTARDFHTFGAFFADIDDEEHLRNQYGGLNTLPTRRTPEMRVTDDAARAVDQRFVERIEAAQSQIDTRTAELDSEQSDWLIELQARIERGDVREQTWVDDALDTGGEASGDWSFLREPGIEPRSGETYRRQSSQGLVQHYTHRTDRKTITVNDGDILFAWVYLPADNPPTALMLQCNTAGNWEHRAVWGSDDIPYGRRAEASPAYRRMGALPETGTWSRLEVPFERIGLAPGTVVSGIAFTQFGGTVYWDRSGVISNQVAPTEIVTILDTPEIQRTPEQLTQLAGFHASQDPQLADLRSQVASIEQERARAEHRLPKVLYTRAMETPREVRILPRGNWLDESGEVVEPGVPEFLGALQVDGRASRLDLARWLVEPEDRNGVGGMTARVFVNRIWAMLFGEGLCPSVEDFGRQGLPPVHPELLDQLALDFMESGWDIKALVRRLVLCDTYRQSSLVDSRLQEIDPENLLHARQARFRVPAEMVRDTMLRISGLLVDRVGGPSVKPPQPAGYYRHLNFPKRRYQSDLNPEQWRRGVYVHWQRQFLHPMLRAFDAPTREECTARRNESNTPLAALVLMNDPTYVEAARAFAQRILAVPGNDRERMVMAMRRAVSRAPTGAELNVLETLLAQGRMQFAKDPDGAQALLSIGASPIDPNQDPLELAAWTQVSRAMLNLHETITRE